MHSEAALEVGSAGCCECVEGCGTGDSEAVGVGTTGYSETVVDGGAAGEGGCTCDAECAADGLVAGDGGASSNGLIAVDGE